MNYNIISESPNLELKLNLSPSRDYNRQVSSTEISPRSSSCVSREVSPDDDETVGYSTTTGSMMLVGCPRCLMYVMLFEEDPKCPKCKSTVLLDFLHEADRARRLVKNN
ncbi:hypothetical protein RD792_009898 [Penstemon davidsonii]|uniref:GIR1-like zinc ribbon domain-containing protein n=1 Tax=Penstemon davidsonii TaxID=160366 RepID=A0ABR0D0D6_9LAMI|nr:hypothetical protein RD792_009898 [Penstemon davidsonii]